MKLNAIGEFLKQNRKRSKLSLKDVYQKTKITDSRLSRIEKGEAKPEPDDLKLLSWLYEIDLVSLYLQTGYLDTRDLSAYKQVFLRTEFLSNDEKLHIQEEINLFTKGRK